MKFGRSVIAALAILALGQMATGYALAELPQSCVVLKRAVKSSCGRSSISKLTKSKLGSRLSKQCITKAKKFQNSCATPVCGYHPYVCPDGAVCVMRETIGISMVVTHTFPSIEVMKSLGAQLLYRGECNS